MVIAAVGIAGVAAFFGLEYWHEQERERVGKRVDWERIVREFRECSMSSALFAMGYRSSTSQDSLGDAISKIWAETNPVAGLLTAGVKNGRVRDIDQIWLDPSVPYSVSTEKGASTSSINLLSQCESRINDGKLKTWLDVGIYYLVVGHPRTVEWLTKAGEVGIADAYVLLGHAYRRNLISSVKDEKQAFNYYLKAAKMGSIKGQLYVAELLQTVNPSQARKYLIAAAEGGSRTAAYRLQHLYWPYSLPTNNESTAAQVLRLAYFWSLVFDFHSSQRSRMTPDAVVDELVRQETSESLYEAPEEYEFEGLPPTPWNGTTLWNKYSNVLDSTDTSEIKLIRNYDYQSAKKNLAALEGKLDVDSRIAVQGVAKKWIGERTGQSYDKPRIQQAELKTPKSEKLPSWKPFPLAVCDGKSATREQSGSDLFRSFKPYIWAVTASAKGSNDEALGTAVAVAPNILATNCHLVSAADEITLIQEQEKHQATVMAADESRDMCLLRINSKLPFVSNAMSLTKVDIGSVAYALGNPQGLNLTFSNGIISGIRRVAGRDFIQTTAPISKGSSGGALIDDKGNLLGITTFYLQGGQAMNFAIPIEAFCRP